MRKFSDYLLEIETKAKDKIMEDWKSALASIGMMSALAAGSPTVSNAAPQSIMQQENSPDAFVKKILAITKNDWTESSASQLADMFLSKNFARVAKKALKSNSAETAWVDPFSSVENTGRTTLSEKTVFNDGKTAIVEAMIKYKTPEAKTDTITAKITIYLVFENGWKVDDVLHNFTGMKTKEMFK